MDNLYQQQIYVWTDLELINHIYIPKDAYILIKDITYACRDPITKKSMKTFEIIIPPITPQGTEQNLDALDLYDDDDDNKIRHYVVNSSFSTENFSDFVEVYEQDKKADITN